jgi:small-conductance mechanosensitive channel
MGEVLSDWRWPERRRDRYAYLSVHSHGDRQLGPLDQSTGRIVQIPNGKVFVEPQTNYTKGWFDCIWNEIPLHLTFESNWKKAKEILQEIVITQAGHLTPLAERKLKESSHEFIILKTVVTFTPAMGAWVVAA